VLSSDIPRGGWFFTTKKPRDYSLFSKKKAEGVFSKKTRVLSDIVGASESFTSLRMPQTICVCTGVTISRSFLS
jgi:hypothetical protein